ncbi:MAG TPA: hypothetical protein VG676_10005 [Chitinophagaceae bacterium]|jgi:hypothetical protein|nr:hypothetical protein [Chitinophagaceae bacterium]
MKSSTTIQPYNETMRFGALAAWMVTILLLATGFQRIKDVVAYVMLKLYEFFIQRNAVKI